MSEMCYFEILFDQELILKPFLNGQEKFSDSLFESSSDHWPLAFRMWKKPLKKEMIIKVPIKPVNEFNSKWLFVYAHLSVLTTKNVWTSTPSITSLSLSNHSCNLNFFNAKFNGTWQNGFFKGCKCLYAFLFLP